MEGAGRPGEVIRRYRATGWYRTVTPYASPNPSIPDTPRPDTLYALLAFAASRVGRPVGLRLG